MIDTHAHIYDEKFEKDVDEIILRSRQLGISHILMPNIDKESIKGMNHLARRYPGYCIPMMGLHPCSVTADNEAFLKYVQEQLQQGEYIAVGEIGTDLFWDKTFWEQQQKVFKQQCEMALDFKLPVVIHCRETIDETIDLVAPFARRGLTGVFHCFTGTSEQAYSIMDLGFYLGIGGVITFKNGGVDRTIGEVGVDKLLLETDSPYLSPTPYRGKRNAPTYLPLVAQKIAEVSGRSVKEIINITDRNAIELFQLDEL